MSNEQDLSRRDLLRSVGSSIILTTAGAGVVTPAIAQHIHSALANEKTTAPKADYKPKYFTTREYQMVRRLSDLIIPADEHSGGALESGAAEFIDFLCGQNHDLAEIYTGGLAWIDDEMKRRYSLGFLEAKPDQQTALLDLIAYRKNDAPQIAPGVRFFVWLRNMVVDAFYTSPVGVKDLGFMGNTAIGHFSVPQEAVDYALKRSPFA